MTDQDNVVRFPFKQRDRLPPPAAGSAANDGKNQPAAVVLHHGRRYEAEALLRQLPPHNMQEVGADAPADLQAFWDEVVRRWPEQANEIAGRVGSLSD